MDDDSIHLAYLQGQKAAQYGAGCTCLFSYGPWKTAWWKGYQEAMGWDESSVRGFYERSTAQTTE